MATMVFISCRTFKSRWFLERSPPAFGVEVGEIEAIKQENGLRRRNHLTRLVLLELILERPRILL